MKLYIGISVTVFNTDNHAPYSSYTGKVSTCFLVGI
ncbi:hypothetical protein EVA_22357 [gut metagenome]|uniref:Uncharacterized protein n=1 Tax=gut metagenome TaxID=749906 RepID=J9F3T6_9ZZZZ